jgi:deaminated glutathione amidase
MKIALLQTVSGTNLEKNLVDAARAVAQAAEQGAELAALPEYFCLMGHHDTDKLKVQERLNYGPIQEALQNMAKQHGVWLVGGTVPIASNDPLHATNTVLVFSPQGERVTRYDKIHLFNFDDGQQHYDEARVLQAGKQPVAFDVPSRDGHTWRVGLSVCYDLRFPELFRALRADLILVPSAFTYVTGQAHWDILLRARAIENLAYVGAPAQGGVHENGRRTWGHSMVIDPWGQVLGSHAEGPGVVLADLQWQQLQQRRIQLPALSHRVLV